MSNYFKIKLLRQHNIALDLFSLAMLKHRFLQPRRRGEDSGHNPGSRGRDRGADCNSSFLQKGPR